MPNYDQTPVALTACMLCLAAEVGVEHAPQAIARLASDIHRLAPACQRQALAEINGEYHDGERRAAQAVADKARLTGGFSDVVLVLDDKIRASAKVVDARVAGLNKSLLPFGYALIRTGLPGNAALEMAALPINDSATRHTIV